MKPYRPGNWWWQCTAGYQRAVEVSMDMEVPGHIVSDGCVPMESITEFEHGQYFDKWLGPALPPKALHVHDAQIVTADGVHGLEKMVRYSDVVEYDSNNYNKELLNET